MSILLTVYLPAIFIPGSSMYKLSQIGGNDPKKLHAKARVPNKFTLTIQVNIAKIFAAFSHKKPHFR
jgi:hypothetical protein